MNYFHIPVLAEKCVQFLNPHAGGVYVDATLGGGGHAWAVFQQCPNIQMIGVDQDDEALQVAAVVLNPYRSNLELIRSNFSRLRTDLALRRIKSIDGIIFDLGVSSHQLDKADRGFSYDSDAPLDMRMDRSSAMTAAIAVNELPVEELTRIFKEYGEELNAGRIARRIVSERVNKPIKTTRELSHLLESVVGKGSKESLKSKARIFQSLRIYVNRELEVLKPALQDAINILKPGGRIVVMSYHSLEDRIVKNVFRAAATGCDCPPRMIKCECGKKKQLNLLTRSPLIADTAEVEKNVRSRSVKLRAAEKIMGES